MAAKAHHRPKGLAFFSSILVASLVSAAINALLFGWAHQQGIIRADLLMPADGQPLTLLPVVLSSVIGCVGAAGVAYGLCAAFPLPLANKLFWLISTLFLLISFASPTLIVNVTPEMMLFLNGLHVVVAMVAVACLQRWVFSTTVASS